MNKFFKYATDNEISYYTRLLDTEEKDEVKETSSYNGISEKIKYHMFVLPSLKDCLENKTHAPFCTYNFNIWLKEVESMDNYLNFILDLISHKRLIDSYKSVRSFSPDNSFQSNSYNYQNNSNQELSNILNHRLNINNNIFKNTENEYNSFNSFVNANDSEQDISNLHISFPGNTSYVSFSSSVKRSITTQDLLYSAKQIFETYLANKDTKKNIDISPTVIREIEKEIYEKKQWGYELFESIFQQALYILNIGPYQRFLIKRIKSNVSHKHSLMRLSIGLLMFFIIIGYLFILLFYKSSKLTRALLSYIPLFIALNFISVYINDFDFIIGFMGKSISGYFEIIDIEDEEIIKFHKWKSKKNLIMVLLLDIIISSIFVFIR